MTNCENSIVNFLRAIGEATPARIIEACGKPAGHIYAAMDRMVKQKALKSQSAGTRGAHLYSLAQ